jgi:hypothetical protein
MPLLRSVFMSLRHLTCMCSDWRSLSSEPLHWPAHVRLAEVLERSGDLEVRFRCFVCGSMPLGVTPCGAVVLLRVIWRVCPSASWFVAISCHHSQAWNRFDSCVFHQAALAIFLRVLHVNRTHPGVHRSVGRVYLACAQVRCGASAAEPISCPLHPGF